MSGCLKVVGIGPGSEALVTPQARAALDDATDAVGYGPYLDRIPERDGLARHASGNREETARARQALELAAAGRRVAIVSSGDPGVFAMASAVFEALEAGPESWSGIPVEILPGVTAMLAAAARAGAPLGHDFCAINLSDNLKPFSLVELRLRLAVEADFAIALYNPRSRARPDGFARALDVLRDACGIADKASSVSDSNSNSNSNSSSESESGSRSRSRSSWDSKSGSGQGDRPVILAQSVSGPGESLRVLPLSEIRGDMADMRTVVIVGSSKTRVLARAAGEAVYTPRFADGESTPSSTAASPVAESSEGANA